MGTRVPLLNLSHEAGLRTLSQTMTGERTLRRIREWAIEKILLLAALVLSLLLRASSGLLLYESLVFFQSVSIDDFFTDTLWTPLFADAHYGILPLVAGTLVTTAIALRRAASRHGDGRLPERIREPARR